VGTGLRSRAFGRRIDPGQAGVAPAWRNLTVSYRNILVPTDGGAPSRRATAVAVALARTLGARVTAVYVVPEGVPTLFSGDKLYGSGVLGPRARAAIRAAASAALGAVACVALAAGVPHRSARTSARSLWRAITRTARTQRCDLIVMGTRGVRGMAVLGSQTLKTVANSRVPVLVCR
jgi:nucleotide-binding universal stress UspA family protein